MVCPPLGTATRHHSQYGAPRGTRYAPSWRGYSSSTRQSPLARTRLQTTRSTFPAATARSPLSRAGGRRRNRRCGDEEDHDGYEPAHCSRPFLGWSSGMFVVLAVARRRWRIGEAGAAEDVASLVGREVSIPDEIAGESLHRRVIARPELAAPRHDRVPPPRCVERSPVGREGEGIDGSGPGRVARVPSSQPADLVPTFDVVENDVRVAVGGGQDLLRGVEREREHRVRVLQRPAYQDQPPCGPECPRTSRVGRRHRSRACRRHP